MILDIKNKILLDNTVQSKVACVVYQFKIGDVEDPEIYAAEPLWQWQQSEAGKWIMEHSLETPSWHKGGISYLDMSTTYHVRTILLAADYTYWKLKFT